MLNNLFLKKIIAFIFIFFTTIFFCVSQTKQAPKNYAPRMEEFENIDRDVNFSSVKSGVSNSLEETLEQFIKSSKILTDAGIVIIVHSDRNGCVIYNKCNITRIHTFIGIWLCIVKATEHAQNCNNACKHKSKKYKLKLVALDTVFLNGSLRLLCLLWLCRSLCGFILR